MAARREAEGGAADAPSERIVFGTLAELPGLVHLAVDHCWRKWELFHQTYTICTVLGGRGEWKYRRRGRATAPNGLMLMEPGEVHVTKKVESPASFRVLFLDPSMVETHAASWRLGPALPHFSTLDTFCPSVVQSFVELHGAIEDGDALKSSELFTRSLWRLFRSCTERAPILPDPPPPQAMRKVRDRIHAAFEADPIGKSFTVGGIAAEFDMNSVQLIRGWTRYWGCAVWSYVTKLRLARAQELIMAGPGEGLRTFAHVAVAAGYADLPHMDKGFAKLLGVSPRAFAQQVGVYDRWSEAQHRPAA